MKARSTVISFILVLSALFFHSCEKAEILSFVHTLEPVTFEVDSALVHPLQGMKQLPVEYKFALNLDSIKKAQKADAITEVRFEEVVLHINSPENMNFNWLEKGRITLASSLMPEMDVATFEVPRDVTEVKPLLSDIKILEFLDGQVVTMRVYLQLREQLPGPKATIEVRSKLKYKISIFK